MLIALLNLSSWCLVMVEWLFLAVQWGCLRLVIVVFPDHTHLLILSNNRENVCFRKVASGGLCFSLNKVSASYQE